MSKHRMQVLLDEKKYRKLQRVARQQGTTVGAWIRDLVDESLRREPRLTVAQKLAAISRAMRVNGPTADIDQMNAEIEQGYLSGEWPR